MSALAESAIHWEGARLRHFNWPKVTTERAKHQMKDDRSSLASSIIDLYAD